MKEIGFHFVSLFSPPFEVLEVWLESLAIHTSVGHRLPTDLIFDIDHYKGSASRESSLSSTPDGMNTPPACKTPRLRTPDGLKTSVTSETNASVPVDKADGEVVNKCDSSSNGNANQAQSNGTDVEPNSIEKSNEFIVPAECGDTKRTLMDIPKSPHLSKDFSPNGDRLRDSVRARRQQRMQQNRESMRKLSDCRRKDDTSAEGGDSTGVGDAPIGNGEGGDESGGKKVRPYGEKGFIINMNGGLLTLNNVKDLENCSDFDSSCDTSLNYLESNAPIEGGGCALNDIKLVDNAKTATDTIKLENGNSIEPTLPDNPMGESNGVVRNKSYKSVLEDLKLKLNLCKSKLDSLETAGRETISSSRTSMKNYFKITPLVHGGGSTNHTEPPQESCAMYSRTSPVSLVANRKSMFEDAGGGGVESDKPKSSKSSRLFRINDTPIFERRNVRAISSLFRRSDSNENIPSKSSYKSKAISETVAPATFILNKPKISPTSDLKANHSFDTIAHVDDNCRPKRGNFTLKKITNRPEVFQNCPKKEYNDRRSLSVKTNHPVATHLDNRRQPKQLFHIEPSSATHKSPSGKVNLLSPERIHKLNAKLTEAKANPKPQQPISHHSVHGNGYLNRIQNRPSTFGPQHHSNLIVHKLPDSTVRRNVGKFDKNVKGCGFAEATPL